MWRELLSANRLAFDIETNGPDELSCVAFAADPHRAFVMPRSRIVDISELLRSEVPKVAQNGQFDLYFLRTRCGIEVANYADDTIVAWHSCYPELAGSAQDRRRKAKRTRKSLAFLASLYTRDEWWKDYDFATEDDQFRLCGRDACITLEVMSHLDAEINRLGVRRIYERQLKMIEPAISLQARGLRIDDGQRSASLDQIDARIARLSCDLEPDVRALFESRRESVPRKNLFWKTHNCACCRNGTRKRDRCWGCAGLDAAPKAKSADDMALAPCTVCDGAGKITSFRFNANSDSQKRILLYNVLKMPKRTKDGKLTVGEAALKSLLAEVQ